MVSFAPPKNRATEVLALTLRIPLSEREPDVITDKNFGEIEAAIRARSAELPRSIETYLMAGLRYAAVYEPRVEDFLEKTSPHPLPASIDDRKKLLDNHSDQVVIKELGSVPICLGKWIHDSINAARVDMISNPSASPFSQPASIGMHETMYKLGELCIGCPIPRD